MNDLRNALHEFWSSFVNPRTGQNIAAFHDVAVVAMHNMSRPQPPPTPYITYEIIRPAYYGVNIATASIWDKGQFPGFHGLIDEVFRQVEEKIPEHGTILQIDNGIIKLMRNSANFTSYMDDPNDALVTRGIIRYEIYNYKT